MVVGVVCEVWGRQTGASLVRREGVILGDAGSEEDKARRGGQRKVATGRGARPSS